MADNYLYHVKLINNGGGYNITATNVVKEGDVYVFDIDPSAPYAVERLAVADVALMLKLEQGAVVPATDETPAQ